MPGVHVRLRSGVVQRYSAPGAPPVQPGRQPVPPTREVPAHPQCTTRRDCEEGGGATLLSDLSA